jgi:hypothetical protein
MSNIIASSFFLDVEFGVSASFLYFIGSVVLFLPYAAGDVESRFCLLGLNDKSGPDDSLFVVFGSDFLVMSVSLALGECGSASRFSSYSH